MLIPEQIYDLDTITLEQRTQQLNQKIIHLGINCSKHLLQTLQLAKLQIQERRNIQLFGLNLQQNFKQFQTQCLYPEEFSINQIEQQDVNKFTNAVSQSQLLPSKVIFSKSKLKMSTKNIADILKHTKIQNQKFTIGKTNLNKPLNNRKITISNNKSKETKKINKIPEMTPFHPFDKQFKIQPSNQKNKNTLITKQKQIKIKVSDTPRQCKYKTKEQQIIVKKKVINKIQFIQNDIYGSSSDQEVQKSNHQNQFIIQQQQNQKNKTVAIKELILQSTERTQSTDSNLQTKQKTNNFISQISDNVSNSTSQQNPIQSNPIQNKVQTKKNEQLEYRDKFDYFRLTQPHKKINLTIEQLYIEKQNIKYVEQQKLYERDKVVDTCDFKIDSPSQLLNQQKNQLMQKKNVQILQQVKHIQFEQSQQRFSIVKTIKQQKQEQNSSKPKSKSLISKNAYKNIMLQKILIELPQFITQYHQLIPNFNALFHPQAQFIDLLRQTYKMLKQHFDVVNPSYHFVPNMDKGIQNLQYQKGRYKHKIRLYGNKIDLNLQNFEWKDQISKLRFNNQIQIPKQSDILYYRVVKTKQQVYDIISSTFNRTNQWAQLPHGMNLKSTWNLLWTWGKPQIDFKKLIYFQKVNHFPHNKNLSRKDMLKKNIERIKRLGPKAYTLFDIIPQSFLLPGQNSAFIQKFFYYKEKQGNKNLWIMKPIGQSRGRGISVINNMQEIIYSEPVVLQKYLKNPLLLDGYKFDLRIYVLVTSINPLEIFLYKEGFARLSTQKYNLNLEYLKNNFVHLTNFAIQRQNFNSHGFSLGGTKISLKMLRQKLKQLKIQWKIIWNQVIEIIIKSNIASMNQIPSNNNCFQLFGYDIIIDQNLKCWLLEINSSPSLQRQYILDQIIKQQLIDDTIALLDIVKYDRTRLLQVISRRISEYQGRKSVINTHNNSILQLNRDLHYILHGKALRKYGQLPCNNGNYELIAPSDLYYSIVKSIQIYKISNIIKK